MEFRVLGPIEVHSGDTLVHAGGIKQRSILALLIAHHGHIVSTDRIVDEIYGEDAAAGARRSVQTIISMLRRTLGDVIVGTGDGYRFDAPSDAVDVCRFEDLVAVGFDTLNDNPSQASSLLGEALDLWRGDPYSDVDGRGLFHTETARLAELRLTALEARIEADLACGRHREVVPELEALVAEYPLRERVWRALMLALYRVGRQADALATYQQLRTVLGEQLGLDPSTELHELEEQILLHDPALDPVVATPHNLPASLTTFVGRRLELIELGETLAEKRLVTLTGAGGSGKTRLAIELGREVLDDYPDGVWFVDLRGVKADGAASLIASTLRVVASDAKPTADHLVDALSSRHLLLVLDNCEHLLDAVAPIVERLVSRDGRCRVLATSREPLGVPGESIMPVHPLPVPEGTNLNELAESEAVALFADRALSAKADFTLEEHIDSIFEICRSVDGLPLALELAAARLVVFSPTELAVRLNDQLAILRSSQRAGDLRHATIESTIGWSWELLNDAERTLLSRLSVFHGTWSLDAAEGICGFERISRNQVADLVTSLVTRSLVIVDGVSGGTTRYRLLEPIREYADRELDGHVALHLRSRMIDHWSATTAEMNDPNAGIALRDYERAKALEVDRANLVVAIEWALASRRYEDATVIFASPFGWLLMMRGSSFEFASNLMTTVLEYREMIPHRLLVWAIEIMCVIAGTDSRNQAWLYYATRGIEVSQSSEERLWFGLAAALATNRLGRHDEAVALLDRIIAQSEDPGIRASALLGLTEYETPKPAWTLTEAALDLSPIEALGWWDEGVAAWLVGIAAFNSGRYDVAIQMAERSVDRCRSIGWSVMEHHSAALLAEIYASVGRLDDADTVVSEALRGVRRILGANINITAFAVLGKAADIAMLDGELDAARAYVEEARLAAARDDLQVLGESATAYRSALIARDDGNLEHARTPLDGMSQSLDGPSPESDAFTPAEVRLAEAGVELRRNDANRALEELRSVLAAPSQLAHIDTLNAVDFAAIALAQLGRAEHTARLLGAVDRERERTGLVIRPPDVLLREAAVLQAQAILGDTWRSFINQGREMTLESAVEYATAEASAVVDRDAAAGNVADVAITPT